MDSSLAFLPPRFGQGSLHIAKSVSSMFDFAAGDLVWMDALEKTVDNVIWQELVLVGQDAYWLHKGSAIST